MTQIEMPHKPHHHSWFNYPGSIFVFGSNKKGIHGAGAAAFAKRYCGAVEGIGWGLMGQSYAIPTKYSPGYSLKKSEVTFNIEQFLAYATQHPEQQFFLTKIGCGLARFDESFIQQHFTNAPSNVIQPPDWCFSYREILQH